MRVSDLAIRVNEEGALEEIRFGGGEHEGDVRRVTAQLEEYFRGERKAFDLQLAPRGTRFQLDVWDELQRIPYGSTISYGELAQRIGRPKAVRAVGAANGANPIPI